MLKRAAHLVDRRRVRLRLTMAALSVLIPALLLTFIIACIAVVIVPGPTVTVIIANSLRHGTIAGLMNVAGTQVGLAMMLVVLGLGLEAVVSAMGEVFVWVKLAGAAYLIWLGIRMWRSDGRLSVADVDAAAIRQHTAADLRAWFWQGLLVHWANPKALLFFGAFIPQFVDPARGSAAVQAMMLGGIFMIVATLLDGAYAALAGRSRAMFQRERVRLLERVSGSFLIGGGLWLALSKRAA